MTRQESQPSAPGVLTCDRSWLDRNAQWLVAAAVIFGLLLRLLALWDLSGSIYYDFLLWDEKIYHKWASALASGTFQSNAVYEFEPLPAYVFAVIYKLFSPRGLWIRLFNILLGSLTCWLVWLALRRMCPPLKRRLSR